MLSAHTCTGAVSRQSEVGFWEHSVDPARVSVPHLSVECIRLFDLWDPSVFYIP